MTDHHPTPADPTPLSCDANRELASAMLDNEATDDEVACSAAHMATCASCRQWERSALLAHRAVRLAPADDVPDLTSQVMRTIQAQQPTRRPSVTPAACIALAVLAASELIGALPHLLSPASALGAHAGREQGAFEIALASGFLYAALRPRLAQGIAVLSTVLAALLVLTSGIDVVDGTVGLALETHHIVALLGTALTWVVTTSVAPLRTTPPRRLAGAH